MQNAKSLILFRHAKSDWDSSYRADHQRPLASRGINAAKRMGKILADSGKLPDKIFCSTATRARQTLELAATAGQWQSEIDYLDDLYDTTVNPMIQFLTQLPDSYQSVMLVGHEPTWSGLTQALMGGGNLRFPTAAMARITFGITGWSELGAGSGELKWLLQPRFFT